MDAFSEVLKVMKLDSTFFYNGEFSAAWSFRSTNSCKLAPYINQPCFGHSAGTSLLNQSPAPPSIGCENAQEEL